MLTTAGVAGATGVFFRPLEKELGWTAEQTSLAFALRIALSGTTAPFAAAFINRFGVRAVVAAAEWARVLRINHAARRGLLWEHNTNTM